MKKVQNIWWLNPSVIYAFVTLVAFYAYSVSEKAYWTLYGVRGKYINEGHLFLYLLSFILFYFGAKYAKAIHVESCFFPYHLKKTYSLLLKLCLVAYAIWFSRFVSIHGFSAFLNPISVSGNVYAYRANSGKIPGLTSMTEFGVCVAPMAMYFFKATKERKYLYHLFLLLFLAMIRSSFFSERLAIMELLVPSIIVYLLCSKYKNWYRYIPVIGVIFVFFVFGLFEYNRSWINFYANHYKGSYINFVIDRVLGYYSIAINTECTNLFFIDSPFFPLSTLQFLWKLPIFNKVPSLFVSNGHINLLEVYGNPEFNNPGGILAGVSDFGFVGIVFSFILGRFSGAFYKSMKKGGVIGLLFYPLFVLCLIELPRYFYFGNNRAFYIIIGMFIICARMRKV